MMDGIQKNIMRLFSYLKLIRKIFYLRLPFVFFALFLISELVVFGQSNIKIIELNEQQFKIAINKLPNQFNEDDWILLKKRAEDAIDNGQFEKSLEYSKKSVILAEKLKNNLLKARSFHTLGLSYQSLEDVDRAYTSYNDSLSVYELLDKSEEILIEVNYVLIDLATLYSNPDYTYSEKTLDIGLKYLYGIYKFSNEQTNSNYKNVNYLASLNIGMSFGISGNFLTQIIWLEKLKISIPKYRK